MSFEPGRSRGLNPALYGPRISQSLVDQLENHLRTLRLPSTGEGPANDFAPPKAPIQVPTSPSVPVQLPIDQLESALSCVKMAAQTMAELNAKAVSPDERAAMQDALARLEARLHAFEHEFAALSNLLHDARRETEEHRQRSNAAEGKLESLMVAVAKMMVPLGTQAATQFTTAPILRVTFQGDEVSA